MLEIIKKYKNGLLGAGIYLFFLLWDLFANIPYSYPTVNEITIKRLVWLVSFFLVFQYILKFIPSFKTVILTPDDPSYSIFAKERAKHLLSTLIITIIFFSIGIFLGKSITSGWDALALLIPIYTSLFLGTVSLIFGSMRSVSLYLKTKDKRFLFLIFAFGLVLLGIVLL